MSNVMRDYPLAADGYREKVPRGYNPNAQPKPLSYGWRDTPIPAQYKPPAPPQLNHGPTMPFPPQQPQVDPQALLRLQQAQRMQEQQRRRQMSESNAWGALWDILPTSAMKGSR